MPIKKQEIRILDFLFEPQRSNFSTKSITVFTKKWLKSVEPVLQQYKIYLINSLSNFHGRH